VDRDIRDIYNREARPRYWFERAKEYAEICFVV
jgi:hypothetical protein